MKKIFILLALLFNFCLTFAQTSFTFSLNRSYRTSAGVFLSDGTLLKTLWSDVTYPSGTFTQIWDNKDSHGVIQTGSVVIKVLYHNVNYVWDGPIGNTSTHISGTTTYTAYQPIIDMVAADTANFFTNGYNELGFNIRSFNPATPGISNSLFTSDNFIGPLCVATDGNVAYLANASGGYQNIHSFVYGISLTTKKSFIFTNGRVTTLTTHAPIVYNTIDDDSSSVAYSYVGNTPPHPFVQKAASGLAVQKTGNLLAVSHFYSNQVKLYDKVSGLLLSSIPVTGPLQVSFSSDGDLWVINNNGSSAVRYTTPGSSPVVAATISTFSNAVAVCVDPINPNIVIFCDAGTSQQVKAFDKLGNSLWVLGQSGGFPLLGPTVTNNKFWFYTESSGPLSYVCVLKDHSFWIGDGENNRSLHFDQNQNYIEQIMSQSAIYSAAVDKNNPTRVFSGYKEFLVDYSKPIQQSWTYVKNWKAGLAYVYFGGFNGLRQIATLTNGRTYALLFNPAYNNRNEILEITANSLRHTNLIPVNAPGTRPSFQPNGDMVITPISFDSTSNWYRKRIIGSDINGNLKFGDSVLIAHATARAFDPIPRSEGFGDVMTPISTSNIVISYDQSNSNGNHLGGIKVGGTKWLWQTMPTGTVNRKGNFDNGHGAQYHGDRVLGYGHNIICGFHGEFWMQGQASQYMHYWDDGLFVGQFGQLGTGRYAQQGMVAGFAGNDFNPTLVSWKKELYVWNNDESGNSPQRWHLVGANNIKEFKGTGLINTTITLQ